jgi:gas vesicle protein
MQYNNRGRPSALTLGAVIGALVAGAAAGLLAAPDSGAGTRRRLRRGLADLSGHTLREHWDDVSAGLERRRVRRAHHAAVERLEERIEELEARLAESEAAHEAEIAEGVEEEEAEPSGHAMGSALGLAAGALLTWFLSSDQAAPARERAREAAGKVGERAREAAGKARERAADEWERFKERRGAYKRTGNRMTPEAPASTGGQGSEQFE